MPVQTNIDALSTTASSNSPAGSESAALVDDYLRQFAAHLATLRDRIASAGSGGADMTAVNAAIAAAFVTHNAASDPHPGYTTSAELATALAGVTAGAPTQVAFATTWDATASKIINAPYTVTGALAMVGTQTGSVPGGFTSGVFIANGTNIPTFNGTAASGWNNTNGARNTVTFTEEVEGIHYWYVNGSRLYAPASGNAVEEVAPATGGAGTTYTLSKSGDTLTLTPSTGAAQNVDLSGYVDATELTAALNNKLSIATAAAYSTTWDTSDINGKWLPSQTPGANFTLTESTSGSVGGGGTACWFTPTANITATIGGVAYSWTAGTAYSVLLLKHRGDEAARWSVSGGAAAAVTVPGVPTGLAASSIGQTSFVLSWVAPVSNGGSAITGYDVWTNNATQYTTVGAATTSVTVNAGITAGTAYSPKVRAQNAVGNGAFTSNISVTTLASGGATAVTLTGPTTSTAGAASTNYTAGANGAIAGTVVVTPTAVAGVTFTPTSVSISSGTPTGTFTATVAAASTVSIAVTNNGGLTNPSAISLTAAAGGPTDALTFAGLAGTTTASTVGGYQSLASTGTGWDAGTWSPDKALQPNASADVYFEVTVPDAATNFWFGLEGDKTTAVDVFGCDYAILCGGTYSQFAGVTLSGDLSRVAGDRLRWVRTPVAGTSGAGRDTGTVVRKRAAGSTWDQIGTFDVTKGDVNLTEPTLYPRVGFNGAISGVVVACNGASV